MKKIFFLLLLFPLFCLSQSQPTSVWQYSGNTANTNTYVLGTKNSRSFRFIANNIEIQKTDSFGNQRYTPTTYTAGIRTPFSFLLPARSGQGASTEIPGFKITGNTRGWLSGAIPTQREVYVTSSTYTASAASVFTDVYGFYVAKPTAGSNVTITNNYGIGTDGNIITTGSVITPTLYGSNAASGTLSILSTTSPTLGTINLGGSSGVLNINSGTVVITPTLVTIGNSKINANQTTTLTTGNTGTMAVLSDAVFGINLSQTASNPADATTYYIGNAPHTQQTTNASPVILPFNCTLVGWTANFQINTTAASAGNSTLSIYVNGAATSLSSAITMTAGSGINTFTASGLSNNFTSGDVVSAQLLTPTWATNPAGVAIGIVFWFVRRQ